MDSMIRLLGVVNRTPPADPMAALEDIFFLLQSEEPADLIVLPRLALSPPSIGALCESRLLCEVTQEALMGLLTRSKEIESFLLLTAVLPDSAGQPTEQLVLIYQGERYLAPLDAPAVFSIGDLRVAAFCEPPSRLPRRIPEILESGCQLAVSLSYEPVVAGSIDAARQALESVSAATGTAVMAVGGGVGDTSAPHLYGGFVLLCEGGLCTAYRLTGFESASLPYDLDVDLLPPPEQSGERFTALAKEPCRAPRQTILRAFQKTPYLPDDPEVAAAYLGEVFALQSRALATRLENTGLKKLVLGVSGGLDSTLALLVAVSACALLDLPRTSILGVTMPGFGTGDRTYYNAMRLMQELSVETMDIPIKNAVSVHFEDIGHNPANRDIVYENAQARERAQILFDLANAKSGLVVGTGDLSEAALGFCTFGGDHLAGYNVNITLCKTMIRALVGQIAESDLFGVGETLRDILDTPVSPELLPGEGESAQKSESILGPYLLHDFFLYHTLTHRLTPKKLLCYGELAFLGDYSPEVIKSALRTFLSRFYTSQFKRSCAPDAANVTVPNLSFYQIPSDLSPHLFLSGLEDPK